MSNTDPLFSQYPALSQTSQSSYRFQENLNETKNALYRLLATEVPVAVQYDVKAENFQKLYLEEFKKTAIPNVIVQGFFTGPENTESDWEETLIKRVEEACQRIAVAQMYFQSKRIRNALARAANRGVKVSVMTAIGNPQAAISVQCFGHRNRVNLIDLFKKVEKNNRCYLSLYNYSQGNRTLHKKVMIVDDYVLAGSSNMGTKSLRLTGDHEMNFEAYSRTFADKAMVVFQEDKRLSMPIQKMTVSLTNRLMSLLHYRYANLLG